MRAAQQGLTAAGGGKIPATATGLWYRTAQKDAWYRTALIGWGSVAQDRLGLGDNTLWAGLGLGGAGSGHLRSEYLGNTLGDIKIYGG